MRKDSSSWRQKRLRYLFRERNEKGHPAEEPLAATQHAGVVPKSQLEFRTMEAVTSDLSLFKLVHPGDFVISLRSFEGGLEHSAYRGILSPAYTVLRSSVEVHHGFFKYLLKSSDFVQSLSRHKKGIRDGQAVPFSTLQDDYLNVPALDVQLRIANFLDEHTARIDALIAQKVRLTYALLEEEQACIDRALLAGLPPGAEFPFMPMSSVVEGEYWTRCALKRFWSVTDCKHVTVEFIDDGIPLASIREVSGGLLDLSAAKQASVADFEMLIEGGRLPRRGDLIYARNASVGAAAFVNVDVPFAMGQDVCLITSLDQDQQFLRYQLMSSPVKAQLESLLVGATIRRINVEHIRNFVVLVPPPKVQRAVVQKVSDELGRRASLRTHIEFHIARLREYRSSLISAAVTGRLDISTFQAKLPEAA